MTIDKCKESDRVDGVLDPDYIADIFVLFV